MQKNKKPKRTRIKFGDEEDSNQFSGSNFFEQSEILEKAEESKFLNENILDGNIFDYDGIYDTQIKQEKEQKKIRKLGRHSKKKDDKKTKYLHNIIDRKNERVIEKNIMLSNVQIKEMKREGILRI